jgi:hypothetical protein
MDLLTSFPLARSRLIAGQYSGNYTTHPRKSTRFSSFSDAECKRGKFKIHDRIQTFDQIANQREDSNADVVPSGILPESLIRF